MTILIIDDDRVFTEPLVWRLEREGHNVVYCQYVSEVLAGWFEIRKGALEHLKKDEGVPACVIRKLETMLEERFETKDKFEAELSKELAGEDLKGCIERIFEEAKQDALEAKPDLILLDVMMPHEDYYSIREVDASKGTGIRLLKDIMARVGGIPVVVITVLDEVKLRSKWVEEFGEVVIKRILVKPLTPTEVIDKLEEIFPGRIKEDTAQSGGVVGGG